MGYLRPLIFVGSFLVVFGMMMTSIATEYWQLMLAQGLVVGLGNMCLFVPCVAVLPFYFSKKRGLAMGIAAMGSSLGGVIYPIIFHRLQPQIGFGWATRVIAFIMLATLVVPVAFMKNRVTPPARRKLFDAKAWTELPYSLYGVALFLGFIGLYIPFFYIQLYALDNGIMGADLAFYILPVMNAGSFFGRFLANALADKAGALNVMTLGNIISAILAFCWLGIHNTTGVFVFAALYGFFSGTYVSLSATVAATALTPSLSVLGVRMGMLLVPTGIGLLIGNPIAGALEVHNWIGLQLFCAVLIIASTVFMVATRVAKVGWGIHEKC